MSAPLPKRERGAESPEMMNASPPTAGPSDSEHEALHRAQRLHEPSMEEILASIRAIIADDRESPPALPEAAPRPTAPSEPRIVYSSEAAARTPVEIAPPATPPEPAPERAVSEIAPPPARLASEIVPPLERETPPPPVVMWARPRAEPLAEAPVADFVPASEPEPEPSIESTLLSEEADRSVAASFEALSASVALQSAELVDRLTREMLRPMIKTWLDEHLPTMVERLVRAEIQRVARGGR